MNSVELCSVWLKCFLSVLFGKAELRLCCTCWCTCKSKLHSILFLPTQIPNASSSCELNLVLDMWNLDCVLLVLLLSVCLSQPQRTRRMAAHPEPSYRLFRGSLPCHCWVPVNNIKKRLQTRPRLYEKCPEITSVILTRSEKFHKFDKFM